MRLKFREKTYIITLILFLIFLNAGIFSLAYYTHMRATESAEEICYAEEAIISESFKKDMRYLTTNNSYDIMETYCDFYIEKDIYLEFAKDEYIIKSYLPDGISAPQMGYSSTQRANGKRYFLITQPLAGGRYRITYAKDVSYLDEDFKSISTVFIITSLGASALLAIILFLVLRKLSSPLEKLHVATEAIASGNFETTADDSGNDEFSLLAKDVNVMAQKVREQLNQLEASAETKQQMLDNLAHEMRTPLTSIRGYAEYILKANIDEEEKHEAAEYIIIESERLKLIGERLLDEAFIRENGIKPEKVNIREIIGEAAKSLEYKAKTNDVELMTECEDIELVCDPLLIRMLITNLADNAIKACLENGRIEFGCRKEENNVIISVSDNGVGMSEEQLMHITEPFYRTDKSRSRSEGGTGLGLSLCDKIVKAHGAKLVFSSKTGVGTKAFVVFTEL